MTLRIGDRINVSQFGREPQYLTVDAEWIERQLRADHAAGAITEEQRDEALMRLREEDRKTSS